jgi:hypothetical protein
MKRKNINKKFISTSDFMPDTDQSNHGTKPSYDNHEIKRPYPDEHFTAKVTEVTDKLSRNSN